MPKRDLAYSGVYDHSTVFGGNSTPGRPMYLRVTCLVGRAMMAPNGWNAQVSASRRLTPGNIKDPAKRAFICSQILRFQTGVLSDSGHHFRADFVRSCKQPRVIREIRANQLGMRAAFLVVWVFSPSNSFQCPENYLRLVTSPRTQAMANRTALIVARSRSSLSAITRSASASTFDSASSFVLP